MNLTRIAIKRIENYLKVPKEDPTKSRTELLAGNSTNKKLKV